MIDGCARIYQPQDFVIKKGLTPRFIRLNPA
jgi:hypothetical protein